MGSGVVSIVTVVAVVVGHWEVVLRVTKLVEVLARVVIIWQPLRVPVAAPEVPGGLEVVVVVIVVVVVGERLVEVWADLLQVVAAFWLLEELPPVGCQILKKKSFHIYNSINIR